MKTLSPAPQITPSKSHPDVEFCVGVQILKTFDEASTAALALAMGRGEADLDVVVCSEAGARWLGGDDAVEQYREDPEASVFERFQIRVNCVGRVA